MSSVNRVLLMGRLTRDPAVRRINDALDVAEFGLACSEWAGHGADGERKEKTTFVDIVVWDRQATTCGEHLRKGMQAFVEGRLQLDEWTDKQSGQRRTRLRVRADRVHFIGGPRGNRERPTAGRDAEERPDRARGSDRPPEPGRRPRTDRAVA